MKIPAVIVALGVAVALLTGCGEAERATAPEDGPPERRKAWITLDGYMRAENVGILMAEERGYFEDVGIDVSVTSPDTPVHTLEYVVNRTVEFGVSHLPQVAIARSRGVPVVAVASLIPRPTAAMIWLRGSKIHRLADLRGRVVAIPGLPFQEAFLRMLLRQAGVMPQEVAVRRVGHELVPALIEGRVDAIFAGSWNGEGAALAARGLKPVVSRVQSQGVPYYDELVLVARADRVARDPDLIRDVITAVTRGTEAAVEHPDRARALIESSGEGDPAAMPAETEAEMGATLPLLSEIGYMDPGRARELVDWMRRQGMIRREVPVAELLTNDYLSLRP